MPLVIRASVVDIRRDSPRDADRFLVDTNAWYWLFYSRASLVPNAPQTYQLADYPAYLKMAIGVASVLYCSGLMFAELAHNIEKAEREIYEVSLPRPVNAKQFRHDYPNQRRKLLALVNDTWADVLCVASMLDLTVDQTFMESALTLFPSVGLDGYDLFMVESALGNGVRQIVTDDGDYASVPGLTVFTANQRVIEEAGRTGRLIVR